MALSFLRVQLLPVPAGQGVMQCSSVSLKLLPSWKVSTVAASTAMVQQAISCNRRCHAMLLRHRMFAGGVGLQREVHAVQDRRNALAGIDILRKICNHPDLLQRAKWEGAPDYGNPARSGKLTVAMKACPEDFRPV